MPHELPTVSEVAQGLAINVTTVNNWVKRFSEFFSDMATGKDGTLTRHFSDEDFLILNTIRAMTAGQPNNAKDWNEVRQQLELGYRDNDFPPTAAFVRSMVVPASTAMKIAGTEAENVALNRIVEEVRKALAESNARVNDLQEQLADERLSHSERIEQLMTDLANERIARVQLEVKLNMIESGWSPPTGKKKKRK